MELGHKMRSAIKAKLMELGCYVDDELPDYIMVMVANKRTKTQMDKDLKLFLRSNTKIFVDWLQKVLKKLEEVRITNPTDSTYEELKTLNSKAVCEFLLKKKKTDISENVDKKIKPIDSDKLITITPIPTKSLTDEIPVNANKIVEKINNSRLIDKTNLDIKNKSLPSTSVQSSIVSHHFKMPTVSEVNELDADLDAIEENLKKAKSRLVSMETDSEDDDFINIKADTEELGNELNYSNNLSLREERIKPNSHKRAVKLNRRVTLSNITPAASQKPIIDLRELLPSRKIKIPPNNTTASNKINIKPEKSLESKIEKPKRISVTEILREEKEIFGKQNINAYSRVVMNKEFSDEEKTKKPGFPSSIVTKPNRADINKLPVREVPSVVQVKPRRIQGICQANKNLLLKAVADAQKSILQMQRKAPKAEPKEVKIVECNSLIEQSRKNSEALFTKKYLEQMKAPTVKNVKVNEKSVTNMKNFIVQVQGIDSKMQTAGSDEDSSEYVPMPVIETELNVDDMNYIPSTIDSNYEDLDDDFDLTSIVKSLENSPDNSKPSSPTSNHQFIVTLDEMKNKFPLDAEESVSSTSTANLIELPKPKKRGPSPIIFNEPDVSAEIPKKKQKKFSAVTTKSKERCKYWPQCRSGPICEYLHPTTPCKMFPMCKFGDRCIYIHPACKFDASCTRKDCSYSHRTKITIKTAVTSTTTYHISAKNSTQDVCKYHPNCVNRSCQFFHPRPCRFGSYCINKAECNFSHDNLPSKEKLTWHSGTIP